LNGQPIILSGETAGGLQVCKLKGETMKRKANSSAKPKLPARKVESTRFENEAALKKVCPLSASMKAIGGQWKIILLWYIHLGCNRFAALQKAVPGGISDKILYEQLNELQAYRLIQKNRDLSYRLTKAGDAICPHLKALNQWSSEYGNGTWL
jgi:DNA-binding HxlR family transcriptional regulator